MTEPGSFSRVKPLIFSLPVAAFLALAVACDTSSSTQPTVDAAGPGEGGGTDGGIKPTFDPKVGSFADARSKVDAIIVQGRNGELSAHDRLLPLQDPLLIVSAIAEVQRAADTSACVNGQFGCPDASTAVALINEYKRNKAALGNALKKMMAVQHGWGRVALAETLLSYLNVLEQAKGLDAAELADLVGAASTLTTALGASQVTQTNGMYPDTPPDATLYRFAFSQIRPAPAPSDAQLQAANAFIKTTFTRLGVLAIGPKPEDPINGLVDRLRKSLSAQGIIVQGIIVQGSEAAQVMNALPYFITVPDAPLSAKADAYLASVDELLDKLAAGTLNDAGWTKYAGSADELAGTFDYSAGSLGASSLAPDVADPLKTPSGDLEDDPNITAKVSIERIWRNGIIQDYPMAPTIRITTTGPVVTTLGDRRRAPTISPTVGDIDLPARTSPTITTDLMVARPLTYVGVAWEVLSSNMGLDHVDLRIENLTTKRRVFHKVYRTDRDMKIAIGTRVPVEREWFQDGQNDLVLQVTVVDRGGFSSGVTCGSLAVKVDAKSTEAVPSTSSQCFKQANGNWERPLSMPPAGADAVIGNYPGSPYRPGAVTTPVKVRIYNDSSKVRRLRSLFTPEYAEFLPIDLNTRKIDGPGTPPIDTGDIAPGAFVDVTYPASTDKVRFFLVDVLNAPRERLVLVNETPRSGSYW